MKWVYNDGGRKAAGYSGSCRDCVTRSVAIATGLPYLDVYQEISRRSGKTARQGQHVWGKWFQEYMTELGWTWTHCMFFGVNKYTHLRDGELPAGRLIVAVSRHYTAVIDGAIHDTFDPSKNGRTRVKGYWRKLDFSAKNANI